ncbi:hypothetical protein GCM10008905_19110 [Clostridium malenominatum]|uniref:AB hydrolase-1 domain-containing protein n=1 Tax=Clostridium malenominatum TaxID=1539 RepID=A0ABN1IZP7_9CLOT
MTSSKCWDSLKDFSEDVNDFCEKLQIKNAITVGWSTGGGVSMYLAYNYYLAVQKREAFMH